MSDKTVRIRRANHDTENRYFMMCRATAQHRILSYEARGVLAYLLSKPDDWEIQVKDLQQPGCGRDKVYRILRELETHSYLSRDFIRVNGVVQGIEYVVYEAPFTEKPFTAQPYTANTEHTYNREEQTTETTTEESRPVFYSVYEQNIGALTPLIVDTLNDLANDYSVQWLCDAITEATKAEKRSLKYAEGILRNWKRDGRNAGKGRGASVHDDPLLGGLNIV